MADSGRLEPNDRLNYLESWEKAIRKKTNWSFKHSVGSFRQEEQDTLLEANKILECFHEFPERLKHHGQVVIGELTQGMIKAVRCFSHASAASPIFAHETENEFDHYCYLHAGCVGTFWTRVFNLDPSLELFAIDYGKALERINVLRDVIEDRESGRILLPRDQLQKFKLQTDRPWQESGWQNFVSDYIERTKPLLQHAANYCNAIPYRELRLRYSSSLPLRIGLASLALYKQERFKKTTSKITRREVRQILLSSLFDTAMGRPIKIGDYL